MLTSAATQLFQMEIVAYMFGYPRVFIITDSTGRPDTPDCVRSIRICSATMGTAWATRREI